MTTKRVTMLKLKEILRLKYAANLSYRQIASCVNLSLGVVSKYLQRADSGIHDGSSISTNVAAEKKNNRVTGSSGA